jgi:hypothetical protein
MGCLEGSGVPVLYRVSQELRSLLRESVPYVKIYRTPHKPTLFDGHYFRNR